MSDPSAQDKPKICFGLSSTHKRPGIRPTASPQPLSDRQVEDAASAPATPVIRHISNNRWTGTAGHESTPPEVLASFTREPGDTAPKYDPNNYGLQVRTSVAATPTATSTTSTSPILLNNAVPGMERLQGEGERLRHDLSHRPEDMQTAEYERMPVENFGAALLRGMGWTEGSAIGKNPAHGLATPINPVPRPKGLGLGADPDALPRQSGRNGSVSAAPPSVAGSHTRGRLSVGSQVGIVSGEHHGMRGVVQELTPRSLRILLAPSNETVLVDRSQVEPLVDHKEPAPGISGAPLPEHEKAMSGPSWLTPHCKVCFVSKTYLGGSVYRKIGHVLDTATDHDDIVRAVVSLTDGRLIADVHQELIQPVHPSVGRQAVVLAGPHQGELGRVIDCLGGIGHLQLLESYDIISVSVDCLAEYV